MLPAVLHITAATGGGVDRYIRDVAALVPGRHRVLHVGPRIDVLEDVGSTRYLPFAANEGDALGLVARATDIVHLHGLGSACRERLATLRQAGAAGFVATLHDLGFLHADLFGGSRLGTPDARWVDAVTPALREARAVLVPSSFIAAQLKSVLPDVRVTVLPPGLAAPRATPVVLPEAFSARRRRRVVAVIGAIGPHKGSALLAEVAAGLEACDASLVVVGYTDDALLGGWRSPGLYVHGPFTDERLAGWLAAYAPSLALFLNRLPESFSYALSEAWASGIPVVVPDQGALGERVRACGGGWLLPPHFDAADALTLLRHLLAEPAERAKVKSRIVAEPARVPGLSAMTEAIHAVYARFGVSARPLDLDALQPLLAANLDGFVFRAELVRLCESLARAEALAQPVVAELDAARAWSAKLDADVAEVKAWAAKLEDDVRELGAAVAARDATIRELSATVEGASAARAVLDRLPAPARALLRRWARRGHG